MPKLVYKKMEFRAEKRGLVKEANRLIDSYTAQGYRLSLRQLYYRFVADDLFPDTWKDESAGGTKNTQKNYDKLGDIIADGRMAGLIDWNAIEDRTRELNAISHWDSPADILQSCERSFRLDKWDNQPYRVECWVEKDALEGVVQQAAHALDVAAFSCRGYTSMSSMWEAAQRLKKYVKAGQAPIILHLGDHDPSGIDMTRDIQDRLNHFLACDWAREERKSWDKNKYFQSGDVVTAIEKDMESRCGKPGITVKRIALNFDQVEEYNPPPNPAKITDSRAKKYIQEHGTQSWELDALEPTVLDALITENILQYRDNEKWNERKNKEEVHREHLGKAARRWNKVEEFLGHLNQ